MRNKALLEQGLEKAGGRHGTGGIRGILPAKGGHGHRKDCGLRSPSVESPEQGLLMPGSFIRSLKRRAYCPRGPSYV